MPEPATTPTAPGARDPLLAAPPAARDPLPAASPGARDPLLAAAHDTCVRCGRPTPLGVALCDEDNPAKIAGPSATQVHGTIFIGLVLGFLALAAVARLSVTGVGPFQGGLAAATARADGSIDVTVTVTNRGPREAAASCRVTRGGMTGPNDLIFLTDPIPTGATITVERTMPAPLPPTLPYEPDRLAVLCR
jgi:hypothetical protein